MDVILLKKVGHLGDLGDKVAVRSGYGRNYLIPQGYAVSATEANVAAFEARRAELERAEAQSLAAAQARREQLDGVTLTIARRAGDEGRLFGSVGTGDIAEAATAKGYPLEKQEVRLPQGPFRAAGTYQVKVHLHPDVDAQLNIEIIPEA